MINRTIYFESRFWQLLICALLALIFISSAKSAEMTLPSDQLLMITSDGCPYCEAFEREVGVSYAFSEESNIFPLNRHNIFVTLPAFLEHIKPATMTPTFIIVKSGKEIGRIVGYSDKDLFWWQLSEFLDY